MMGNQLPGGANGYGQLIDLAARRTLKGSGGGGTFDDMEARVSRLEQLFDKIDAKLDKLGEDIGSVKLDMSMVKGRVMVLPDANAFGQLQGKISGMPTGEQFGQLQGRLSDLPTSREFGQLQQRVDNLPTIAKIAAVVSTIGTLLAIAINAPKIYEWISPPAKQATSAAAPGIPLPAQILVPPVPPNTSATEYFVRNPSTLPRQ